MDQVRNHVRFQVPPLLVALRTVTCVAARCVGLLAVEMYQILLCVARLAEDRYSGRLHRLHDVWRGLVARFTSAVHIHKIAVAVCTHCDVKNLAVVVGVDIAVAV